MPPPDAHPLPGRDVVVHGLDVLGAGVGALRLHVVEHGSGDGSPVLLLHGAGTSSYLWRDVARGLERDRACLMPDLLGCGESERPAHAPAYRLKEQAGVLLRLLEQLQVDRFVAVGAGLGGAVAVHLAALAGPRVAGLALVGAALHPEVWPSPPVVPLLTPGAGRSLLALLRSRPGLARLAMSRLLSADLGARELDRYLAPLLTAEGSEALLQLLRAVELAPTARAWDVVCSAPPPTLVLWGDEDRVRSTAYGRRLAAEAPGAVWAPVAAAGHLLPTQRPERVAEELSAFLSTL